MEKLARTEQRAGMSLFAKGSWKELAAEVQLLVLTVFTLEQLVSLRTLSRGWRKVADVALRRLTAVSVSEKSLPIAALYCCRLQTLELQTSSTGPMPSQLILQNAATLTRISLASRPGPSGCLDALVKCASLRQLEVCSRRGVVHESSLARVASGCPQLESVILRQVSSWRPLLGGKLPFLRKIHIDRPHLAKQELPSLATLCLLEDLQLLLSARSAALYREAFEALAGLPRLTSLSVVFEHRSRRFSPFRSEEEAQVLPPFKALVALKIAAYDAWLTRPAELLPRFSAPSLTRLDPKNLHFTPAELAERFPTLTALKLSEKGRFETGDEDAEEAEEEDDDEDTAEGEEEADAGDAPEGEAEQGIWPPLRILTLLPEALDYWVSHGILVPSITRLHLHVPLEYEPETIRRVLSGLPQLKCLIITSYEGKEGGSQPLWLDFEEEEEEFSHPLEELYLKALPKFRLSRSSWRPLLQQLTAAALPALRRLRVTGATDDADISTFLPSESWSSLEEVTFVDCCNLTAGEWYDENDEKQDDPLPSLRRLYMYKCPKAEESALAGLCPSGACTLAVFPGMPSNASVCPIYDDD